MHWGAGLFGYFPTYTLGNLIAAQLWTRLSEDLPEIDAQLARGELAPLREWLREHIHRHGRKFPPRELLLRATGDTLRPEPFLDYLRAKLADAGASVRSACASIRLSRLSRGRPDDRSRRVRGTFDGSVIGHGAGRRRSRHGTRRGRREPWSIRCK